MRQSWENAEEENGNPDPILKDRCTSRNQINGPHLSQMDPCRVCLPDCASVVGYSSRPLPLKTVFFICRNIVKRTRPVEEPT